MDVTLLLGINRDYSIKMHHVESANIYHRKWENAFINYGILLKHKISIVNAVISKAFAKITFVTNESEQKLYLPLPCGAFLLFW